MNSPGKTKQKKAVAKNTRATGTANSQRSRAARVMKILARLYPDDKPTLTNVNPLQLLVATILSAQCTDVQVNRVTPALFRKYRSARGFAGADRAELEQLIRSTGFYRQKAKSIISSCRTLVEKFGGKVPDRMEDLLTLRGVARKTANVVIWHAFGQNAGFTVDTHVKRLTKRMGFTESTDPRRIEQDMMKIIPRNEWNQFAHKLIAHGRAVCFARHPDCERCEMNGICPGAEMDLNKAKLKPDARPSTLNP